MDWVKLIFIPNKLLFIDLDTCSYSRFSLYDFGFHALVILYDLAVNFCFHCPNNGKSRVQLNVNINFAGSYMNMDLYSLLPLVIILFVVTVGV